MLRRGITAQLLLLAVLASGAHAQRLRVDLTGVDLFWRVTEILSQDRQPDSTLWQALFATPGYAALRNDARIRSNIELVFRPANAELLADTMAHANYWRKRDLQHLIAVRAARAELMKFQRGLNIDAAVRRGIEEAAFFLPPGATAGASVPPIRFVIFSPDARAMGGNIIFDLAFTRDLGFDLLAKTIGHELHHHLMGPLASFRTPHADDRYYALVRAVRQLQVEGVADLIDKEAINQARANDPRWQEQWGEPFATTNQRLAVLDSMLSVLHRDSAQLVAFGNRALNELFPMAGHPNGYAMAKLVLEQLGREAIIAGLENPFAFLRLYQQASRRSGQGHVFSENALRYLTHLEKLFAR